MPAKASRNIENIAPTSGFSRPSPAHRDISVSSSPSALRTSATTANAPRVLKPYATRKTIVDDNPAGLAAITPVRMKPECATAEYANIRLTSDCVTALIVPMAIVRIAIAHITGRHSTWKPGRAT